MRQRHALEPVAPIKGISGDFTYARGNSDRFERVAVHAHFLRDDGEIARQINGNKRITTCKRTLVDIYVVKIAIKRNGRKRSATGKGVIADSGYCFRNGDLGERRAVMEALQAYHLQICRQGDGGKLCEIRKS